jgi:hypothetical protein
MAVNYGTKRIVTGAHYGFRDWLSPAHHGRPDGAVHPRPAAQVLLHQRPDRLRQVGWHLLGAVDEG